MQETQFKKIDTASLPVGYREETITSEIAKGKTLEIIAKKAGCRDPLVLWNNTIIDGRHRYAICQKHGIKLEETS